MEIIDYIVVVVYFCAMIVIGVIASRRVKSSKDFTSAGQQLPLILVIGSSIATCMGASVIFGNYSGVHAYGLSGYLGTLTYFLGWALLIPFSKFFRSSGAASLPEYLGLSYNKKTETIASIAILIFLLGSTANIFIAFGTMCETLGLCSQSVGIVIGAFVVVLFTVFSGLWGVALTDTLQMVIIVVAIVIAIPIISFLKAGGIGYVFTNTDPARLNPFQGLPPATLLSFVAARMLSASVDPAYTQRALAAKDTKTAVKGTMMSVGVAFIIYCIVIIPVFTIPFIFPDMTDGAQFVPSFVLAYFPPVAKGLSFAAILGLLLTTGDSYLLLISSTVTDNILPKFRPDYDDAKKLKLCRLIVCVMPVIIVPIALYWQDIYSLTNATGSAYGAALFFPVVFAILWKKKMNKKIVNIAMSVGCFSAIIWDYGLKSITGTSGILVGGALCLIICLVARFVSEKGVDVAEAE